MEIEDTTQLSRVLAKIEQLPNVLEARRRTTS
jgi:(p)ppGpp synthase/HD superfamily hydrolase